MSLQVQKGEWWSLEKMRTVITESKEGAAGRHGASFNCTTGAAE